MSSVREWLDAALTPLLPGGWKIIPVQRMPETISTTTVVLKVLGIQPLAEAPAGCLSNEVLITIADPHANQATAENALDDSVLELVTALDTLPGLTWTGAKKVLVSERYLGWDITTTITSQKEQ